MCVVEHVVCVCVCVCARVCVCVFARVRAAPPGVCASGPVGVVVCATNTPPRPPNPHTHGQLLASQR
jgi:hypothetical protein